MVHAHASELGHALSVRRYDPGVGWKERLASYTKAIPVLLYLYRLLHFEAGGTTTSVYMATWRE